MMQVLNKTGANFIRLLTTINRNMLIAEKAVRGYIKNSY